MVGRPSVAWPDHGIHDKVVPDAGPKLRFSEQPFAHEASLLQRSLLGGILDVSHRLDASSLGRREKMLGQLALGFAAKPVTSPVRDQIDADVPGHRLRVGVRSARHATTPYLPRPVDGQNLDDEGSPKLGDQSVFFNCTPEWPALPAQEVELAGVLRSLPALEKLRVIASYPAQRDLVLGHSGDVATGESSPKATIEW